MSKKKRNKRYKGSADAVKPTVVKVSAVKRHPAKQWWVDHRTTAKPMLAIAGIIVAGIIIVIGFISLF